MFNLMLPFRWTPRIRLLPGVAFALTVFVWVVLILAWPWLIHWFNFGGGLSAILLGLLSGLYWGVVIANTVSRDWHAGLLGGAGGVTIDGISSAPADQITSVVGALNKLVAVIVPIVVSIVQAAGIVNPSVDVV